MFGEVMRQEEVCKLFLEALLGKKVACIKFIDKQVDCSDTPNYHGIRLDVYLADAAGTVYNIEMQNADDDDIFRRARYYQSGMDRRLLAKGVKKYSELKESYIIFVCSFDKFKAGRAVYERQFIIKDCPEGIYDDGSHVFILNTAYRHGNGSVAILEFLRFVRTSDYGFVGTSDLLREARTALAKVRNDPEKEVAYMTYKRKMDEMKQEGLEEGLQKGLQQGLQRGRIESHVELVQALMASMSFSFVQACETLKISGEDRELIRKILEG